MEIMNILNEWYSMTNDERSFVKNIQYNKAKEDIDNSETPFNLGFIVKKTGVWLVTEKFNELEELCSK